MPAPRRGDGVTWRERIHGPAVRVMSSRGPVLRRGALVWGYFRGRATWCDNPEIMRAIITHAPGSDSRVGWSVLVDKRSLVAVKPKMYGKR